MAHAITVQPEPIRSKSGRFIVHQVPAASDNVIWLMEYAPGQCAVVDGPSSTEVLDYIQQHKLQLTTILNTHTHGDHIGINRCLGKKGLIHNMRVIGARKREKDVPFITEPVDDGDSITLGDIVGMVWLTEGHINGHLSYTFEDFLFCGDTLFVGGCGYLFDGPPAKMHHSLQRLARLPVDTKVCCAHEYTQDNLRFAYSLEPNNQALQDKMSIIWKKRSVGESSLPSTIGEERETNPFIRTDSPELKKSLHRVFNNVEDASPEQIFTYARQHKDSKHYRALPEPSFLQ